MRLAIEPEGGGRRVELPRAGVLTIGSGRADVVLSGPGVGEAHCVIGRVKGGGWAVKDLGTPSGTEVDGARVESAKLEAGQVLTLGSVRLRVVDPSAPVEAPASPAAASRAAAALGQVTGYRIERPLGRGGMGQVFLAVQESLGRNVALKVLAERFSADADFVRRFQAEARAAAALSHPNIVTVYDVWEERGRHFLSMEFMSGGTLEDRVAKEGPLSPAETVAVLSDAAKGLVYAELRGIVHRDIKPDNLMRDAVGTTKIADLGLATQLEAEATDEGGGKKIFGTPHFIAPEQARGERVDGRADLYALGATAYRLLSGRTPFEGATTREILRGHLLETPRPLAEFVPGVPSVLSQLVSKLLAKKPEERYASAGALLTELERLKLELLHGVQSGGAASAPRSRIGALVGAVVALAAVAGGAWWFLGRAEQPERGSPVATVPDVADDTLDVVAPDEPQEIEESDDTPAPFALDDDSALARLERDAEEAWNGLSQSLDREARRLELLRLAREYAGTTAAGRFQREAEQLAQAEASEANAVQQGNLLVEQALAELRKVSGVVRAGGALALELAALAAVPVEEPIASDPTYTAGARALWLDAVVAADERASAALDAADARIAAGDFEGLAGELAELREGLAEDAWPALPASLTDAPELAHLRDTRERANALLAGLDDLATRWRLTTEREDRTAQAQSLRAGGGFESELRDLRLDAARARLEKLAGTLPLDASRERVVRLADDLAAARTALDGLARAWDAGLWRRRTINDPRLRGRANREVVGANAGGLVLQDGGSVEQLPWSAFGGRPAELHSLFHERLTRDFEARELQGISALLTTSAVLQAIEEGSEILEPDNPGVLNDEETRALTEGFEVARPWAVLAGREAELERELAAARVAAGALRATSDGRLGASVAALERLLAEHRDSLLVRLVSDGGVVAGLDPELPEVPPERLPDPAPAAAVEDGEAAPVEAASGAGDGR